LRKVINNKNALFQVFYGVFFEKMRSVSLEMRISNNSTKAVPFNSKKLTVLSVNLKREYSDLHSNCHNRNKKKLSEVGR